jgi:DNA (cytosine-5)-methyltransferase 1
VDARPFKVLSLFAGGGGFDMATKLAVPLSRTVCYVENEAAACAILVARMQEGALDDAPLWTDVTSFDGKEWRGLVDLIIGGFPCQDLSVAGKQEGIEGSRSGLWLEYHRILQETNAPYAFIENVGAGAGNWLPTVRESLHEIGYSSVSVRVRASDVGAPHKRLRTFIFAYPVSGNLRLQSGRRGWQSRTNSPLLGNPYSVLADSSCELRDGTGETGAGRRTEPTDSSCEPADTKSKRQRKSNDKARAKPRKGSREDAGGDDRKSTNSKCKRLEKRQGKSGDNGKKQSAAKRSSRVATESEIDGRNQRRAESEGQQGRQDVAECDCPDADTNRRRCESERRGWIFDRRRQTFRYDTDGLCSGCSYRRTPWASESPVCRVVDGVAGRLDRLRILGNGVVPQQAAMALSFLIETVHEKTR